ncbi:N-formylglutamate amidohydrolase [Henriciella sp.]|uniref:N-formylglutamate amidohydrolase n=1 Tax=Henriciella sp. TaxID=1968823 RepID=UPI0026073F13|nr:N-formylglutamate amidohydrolase [Henriciella sp.]
MSVVEKEQGPLEGPARPERAYTLARPQDERAPVLIASPHSGTHYPEALVSNLCVPLMDLRRTEDAYVDRLIDKAPDLGATLIAATHARSYVDLNRDPRELDAGMFEGRPPGPVATPTPRVQAGLGCLPRIGAGGETIYAKKLSTADGEARLLGTHAPYHQALGDEIAALRQDFGSMILLDMHSMPSRQPGRPNLPDIVLGDRFGSSCTSKLTGLAERTFRKHGLSVTRNAPYAGGYTTRMYGRPQRGAHALQIEINRALYLDEMNVELLPQADALRDVLQDMMAEVVQLSLRICP